MFHLEVAHFSDAQRGVENERYHGFVSHSGRARVCSQRFVAPRAGFVASSEQRYDLLLCERLNGGLVDAWWGYLADDVGLGVVVGDCPAPKAAEGCVVVAQRFGGAGFGGMGVVVGGCDALGHGDFFCSQHGHEQLYVHGGDFVEWGGWLYVFTEQFEGVGVVSQCVLTEVACLAMYAVSCYRLVQCDGVFSSHVVYAPSFFQKWLKTCYFWFTIRKNEASGRHWPVFHR